MSFNKTILFFLFLLSVMYGHAQQRIIVDISGKGNFRSIQAAINSLPDSSAVPRLIYIKNGLYNEKVYIEKHNIILRGESREKTIVTQSISRDGWRCRHMDDWGVATINIDANDISLENLTIVNSFGFDWKKETVIPCPSDTVTRKKILTKNGHQMALRTMNGTRIRAVNCHFKAFGGDTVSPWEVNNGMFYFRDCIMEGGVDFYCPRGWAWAENCRFIAHSGTAAIWHDGSANPDSKTVLKNCRFEGFNGFNLGRYHRDAQFFILNSTFAKEMADKDIFLVPTANNIRWGRRVYYFNSHREGGDYAWHKDNLPDSLAASDITPDWLFDGRWKPHLQSASGFTPMAHVRMRKRNADSSYGANLKKEVMPKDHMPNDFTKTAIPYYQTEGPAWENDKVGFRLYFDERNAKDIFGKTTASMVMDTVGTYGDKYYHHYDSTWGMDILKVGTSLGAGGLAIQVKDATGKDTILRLGPNVRETSYELIKDGLYEAVFRLRYKDWKVLDRVYQLDEIISIKKGDYYYQSSVTMKGLKGDEKIVIGMVNFKTEEMMIHNFNGHKVIFSVDRQTMNDEYLAMAIMVRGNDVEESVIPPNRKLISDSYIALKPIKNGESVQYRFYALWDKSISGYDNYRRVMKYMEKEANGNPIHIMKKTQKK